MEIKRGSAISIEQCLSQLSRLRHYFMSKNQLFVRLIIWDGWSMSKLKLHRIFGNQLMPQCRQIGLYLRKGGDHTLWNLHSQKVLQPSEARAIWKPSESSASLRDLPESEESSELCGLCFLNPDPRHPHAYVTI
jgi:hypothetical protein